MSFDILDALKKAEPLGFLASLSLVISAFTFDGVGNIYKIYSYSVVSAFMFIFSFVFSISNQYFKSVESYYLAIGLEEPAITIILRVVTHFGIYFFLSIGVIFLILIAYQFAQSQTQISIITGAFFGVFVFSMGTYESIKKLKGAIEQRGKISLLDITDIGMSIFGTLVTVSFIIIVIEAIFEIEDLTENYIKFLSSSSVIQLVQ